MHKLRIPGFAKMSKEQYEAATSDLGPVLISAGPGSGKTTVLTHRILYLILEMGISPQDIYVITFSKDAALSMNKRYQEILQELERDTADYGAVHFGTFHSFFYQIIRSHSKYKNYTLLNTSGRSGILFGVLKKTGMEGVQGKELQKVLADISFYKNTGMLPKEQGEEFCELVAAYDQEKENAKMLDFDDMLTICERLLKDDEKLRDVWQGRIGYLLVDEFQDTNMVQYEVLKLLIKAPYNLCLVGDDDQAIYGFRGSKPGIIKQFLVDYPAAKHYTLGMNYRCGERIVRCSGRLIEQNMQRIMKKLSAYQPAESGIVNIKGYESYTEMVRGCAAELKELGEKELSEHAVLFRTNLRMNMFLVELIKNRIPFRTKEKLSSVYEHFVVKDIMDYFRAAAGNRERRLFLRILNKPRTYIGREALWEEQVNLDKIIRFYGNAGMQNYPAMNDAVRFKSGLENLRKLRLSLGIEFILHYFGYEHFLRNKACGDMELYEEWLGLVQWLKEDSKSFRDYSQWEKFQQEYISKAENQENNGSQKEGVNVMTLHGCKGLEFKNVYIMYVNEGNIPSQKRGENLSEEALEEERRLFYVGMTRAKEVLNILYVKQTQESPRPPSRFLKELKN